VLVARQTDDLVARPPAERRETLRAELRLLAPSRRLALRGTAESLEYRLVAAADAPDPGGLVIADRVARLIGRLVAVSRPFRDPADRPQAEAEARATLEAAEAATDGPRVVRADRLPAYRILGGLHDIPDGQRLSRALLGPVLSGRAATVAARLATLRAVLDAAGPIEAAQALGVHRNTIAYRIRRLEELGGWDLSDPDLRLALSAALRIVQNAQD
jgi:DNA-binding PucR family transcriptional regulator